MSSFVGRFLKEPYLPDPRLKLSVLSVLPEELKTKKISWKELSDSHTVGNEQTIKLSPQFFGGKLIVANDNRKSFAVPLLVKQKVPLETSTAFFSKEPRYYNRCLADFVIQLRFATQRDMTILKICPKGFSHINTAAAPKSEILYGPTCRTGSTFTRAD